MTETRSIRVYAVDPGPEQSALVVFDGLTVLNHQTVPNWQWRCAT